MEIRILRLACFLLALTCLACSDSKSSDEPQTPELRGTMTFATPQASDISETSFIVSVDVKTEGTSPSATGFCIGTETNPTISGQKISTAIVSGRMQAGISGLIAATRYYVRAYAVVSGEVQYSSEIAVETARSQPGESSITPAEVEAYRGPNYADDYRSMASWAQRSQWNLANVHDPTVMLADDGYFYMYHTDASYGNVLPSDEHFHGRRSRDLVNWEYLGSTLKGDPAWVLEKTNEYRKKLGLAALQSMNPHGYWAPCVRNLGNGRYRMYYSVASEGDLIDGEGTWWERSYIGMLETSDPASNKWEDKGFVICSSSDRGTNWKRPAGQEWSAYNCWNAIDPCLVVTPEGEHWLFYGSWHCGIAAVQLDPETGKPLAELPDPWGTAKDIAPYGKMVATRQADNRWQASEGAEVVYHDGYYYMFLAYDALDVPYNTRVVRSSSVWGPYVGIDGTDVTNFGGDAYPIVTHPYKFNEGQGWVGISHCAVFSDGQGKWYFASQGRFPKSYDNAIMMGHVRSLRWTSSGWPVVMPERYGAVPQPSVSEAELVGSWQHIDLSYKYGMQKTAVELTLAADHTVTAGTWKGEIWSFDVEKQTLKIKNIELYVARECDWEKTERPACLVYAGISGRYTYWGKK